MECAHDVSFLSGSVVITALRALGDTGLPAVFVRHVRLPSLCDVPCHPIGCHDLFLCVGVQGCVDMFWLVVRSTVVVDSPGEFKSVSGGAWAG